MSTSSQPNDGFQPSLWERGVPVTASDPACCPLCDVEFASSQDLAKNTELDINTRFEAYRMHRRTHYDWNDETEDTVPSENPLMDEYYGNNDESYQTTLDQDEEVAGIYDVTIHYDSRLTARVVAANEDRAEDRAERLAIDKEKCVGGYVPQAEKTHKTHTDTNKIQSLTRGEIQESEDIDEDDEGINFADLLPGWPF